MPTPVQVMLDDGEHAALKLLSLSRKVSMASLVKEGIDLVLKGPRSAGRVKLSNDGKTATVSLSKALEDPAFREAEIARGVELARKAQAETTSRVKRST